MDLLIPDVTYDHPERDRDGFLADIRRELSTFSDSFQLQDDEVPEAAHWPVILAAFSALFLLGKPIKDNLDAWVALAMRFRGLLQRLKAKFGAPRIDANGASLIAVAAIVDAFAPIMLAEVLATELRLAEYSVRSPEKITHHPFNVFLRAYRDDSGRTYLVIVRSTGDVDLLHAYTRHEL